MASYLVRAIVDAVTHTDSDACADCKARNPRWASHNLGIFIWWAQYYSLAPPESHKALFAA